LTPSARTPKVRQIGKEGSAPEAGPFSFPG
jgi:hypothetical protein